MRCTAKRLPNDRVWSRATDGLLGVILRPSAGRDFSWRRLVLAPSPHDIAEISRRALIDVANNEPSFTVMNGLLPEHLDPAAAAYWHAFSRKLRFPLGPSHKAVAFIRRALDPDHAISAVSLRGDFLGVAGFKTPSGAFVGGTFADLARVYGTFSATIRGLLVGTLERRCDDRTLLMDGIVVRPAARGMGVGTALLAAIEQHAVNLGLKQIRLDVIDTNPRARALYERQGYEARSVLSTGPLGAVFGFASATTMYKSTVVLPE
jgi:ribosomal protein S18 acetylase RimI-like enzyme